MDAVRRPTNYTDTLTAATAVQREAESLGSDLEAVLSLIAARSRSLLRAAGSAIALRLDEKGESDDADFMTCRACAGPCAPPLGMRFQLSSGFSAECVRSGKLLRCDDSETDQRVDLQTCRALGIRSMLAAPVRSSEKVIGLLEVFSEAPAAFTDKDSAVLQRFAETIMVAVNRATRAQHPPSQPPPYPFPASPSSILFASTREDGAEADQQESNSDQEKAQEKDNVGGIRLPRAHLYLLFVAAATIFLALGYLTGPWIQDKLHSRQRNGDHTVLASSKPPVDSLNLSSLNLSPDAANLPQLQELAQKGNPLAQNAMGLLYSVGDDKQGVRRDENEAARWFTKAAENGNVSAQSKLGSLYWSGRGVAKDDSRAYFWTVLARASGDDASKALAPFIAVRLTPAQRTAIEQEAERWLQQHEFPVNPTAAVH